MTVKPASKSAVASLVAFAALVACGGPELPAKAPEPKAVPHDPSWLGRVSETCARIASCTHAHDAPRLRDPSACVDWWLETADAKETDPLHKCLADASSCDQIGTCMHGGGDARAAAFCKQRPGVVSGCDGDRLVSCSDDDAQESTVTDCAAMGATCRELKTAGGLVVRSCFSPQKCPPNAPEARCDGTGAVLTCHDGALERASCRPGTRCEEHKDEAGESTASCELSGKNRCESLGARHCEGDRLVECHGQGHFGKIRVSDCVGFGLRCTGSGPRAGCYVASDIECDKEMLPKCDNGAIVFCAAGRLTRVACSKIGMATCDPAARGPVAACSPGAGPMTEPPPARPAK